MLRKKTVKGRVLTKAEHRMEDAPVDEATLATALEAIAENDGAEIPREQWPLAEVLVKRGLITLGPARGPGGDWRRAEIATPVRSNPLADLAAWSARIAAEMSTMGKARAKVRKYDRTQRAKKPTFPPKLSDVEKVLGPAKKWAGRCYEIACALVRHGFVDGVAVYGHWLGKVEPLSYFAVRGAAGAPFVQHGWIQVRGNSNVIIDPTRWAFTGEDPFIYFGPNRGEYDEGGNGWRKVMRSPCPDFDPDEDLHEFTQALLPGKAWTHVERMLGSRYLIDIGDLEPGTVTGRQLFWLANAPYEDLEPHAKAIYTAIEKLGEMAAIPIDNYRRAMR